ncbi:MAG: phosphatase PAP2 family protein [Anaerolineales bacterium]|nr:phosphatase PAP2 family protein [Anaerolineales bacterium]
MSESETPIPGNTWINKVLLLDARLSTKLTAAQRHAGWRTAFRFLAHSGDSWFMIPVMGVIWLLGDGMWKWRMLVMFLAVCITALTAVGLKRLIGRSRPAGDWGLIYRSTDPHSFPSGHAARMAMLAILTLALGPWWLSLLFFLWAPLVALARVAMGVHYLSDVAGGTVLGAAFGIVFAAIL